MKLFPVVRIDCGDPMDRSEWIPLSKVEKIKINLDGTDYILANGVWETCYEGCFNISDYFDEELMEAEQTEPSNSEKPNNCEPQTDLVNDSQVLAKDLVDDEFNPYDEVCMRCKHLKLKCEFIPTYCKFESRDEPQTSGLVWTEDAIKNEPKSYTTWASTDEPQTQLTAKCLECNNSKACKENHWEGCRYEPLGYEVTAVVGTMKDEPQTEREGE